jgi:hypothetical protein
MYCQCCPTIYKIGKYFIKISYNRNSKLVIITILWNCLTKYVNAIAFIPTGMMRLGTCNGRASNIVVIGCKAYIFAFLKISIFLLSHLTFYLGFSSVPFRTTLWVDISYNYCLVRSLIEQACTPTETREGVSFVDPAISESRFQCAGL